MSPVGFLEMRRVLTSTSSVEALLCFWGAQLHSLGLTAGPKEWYTLRVCTVSAGAETLRVQRNVVVSAETYEKVFRRLRKEIIPGETKHLIVLLGVPIAYPRLVWLENLYFHRNLQLPRSYPLFLG